MQAFLPGPPVRVLPLLRGLLLRLLPPSFGRAPANSGRALPRDVCAPAGDGRAPTDFGCALPRDGCALAGDLSAPARDVPALAGVVS